MEATIKYSYFEFDCFKDLNVIKLCWKNIDLKDN